MLVVLPQRSRPGGLPLCLPLCVPLCHCVCHLVFASCCSHGGAGRSFARPPPSLHTARGRPASIASIATTHRTGWQQLRRLGMHLLGRPLLGGHSAVESACPRRRRPLVGCAATSSLPFCLSSSNNKAHVRRSMVAGARGDSSGESLAESAGRLQCAGCRAHNRRPSASPKRLLLSRRSPLAAAAVTSRKGLPSLPPPASSPRCPQSSVCNFQCRKTRLRVCVLVPGSLVSPAISWLGWDGQSETRLTNAPQSRLRCRDRPCQALLP